MGKRLLSVLALLGMFAGIGDAASLPGVRLISASTRYEKSRLDFSSVRSIPGGVAFPGVAKPENRETITAIDYLPKRADGQRLRLKLTDRHGNNHDVFPKIFDWQLGPIVKYADDAEHDSLVSYKGIGREEVAGKQVRGFKFAYHPAVSGELLGMRLWHADFLLFRPELRRLDAARVDLPTDETTGNYILGAGEEAPNVAANRKRLAALQEVMAKKDVKWRSYVITDKDRPVSFGLEDGKLVLKGTPVWWFFSKGDLDKPVPHEEFSKAITAVIEEHGGINPQVYDSLVTTMQYSALFRHIKTDAPVVWAAFAKDINDRKLGMAADTPTLIEVAQTIP
jgi:hypothetical protein